MKNWRWFVWNWSVRALELWSFRTLGSGLRVKPIQLCGPLRLLSRKVGTSCGSLWKKEHWSFRAFERWTTYE